MSSSPPGRPLHIRWLGRVPYTEALDLQHALFAGPADHLLLLEHPPVYTEGVRARREHLLVDPEAVGAELVAADRGGDITFHGPGQLVGYPILSVPGRRGGGMADTVDYVTTIEQIVIDTLADLGLGADRRPGFPGVWVDAARPTARKIAAIGVRLTRGRSMHGFAINVDTDLGWFDHIVPCGIADRGVTSLRAEGIEASMASVIDRVAHHAARRLADGRPVSRHDVAHRISPTDLAPFTRGEGPGDTIRPDRSVERHHREQPERAGVPVQLGRRLDQAGVDAGLDVSARKPDWMRVKLSTGDEFRRLSAVSRELGLVTVCEEAGCPNIFECWNEGTATFMLLGERCTRACGFCLVDTRKPEVADPDEPLRIAEAIGRLGLDFAVLTMVARDDLDDGGAAIVADTVRAIHASTPGVGVEVLISDLKGSARDLATVCDARPEVLNHNIETVARLQRAVRPSAGYARSLTLLARAKAHGLTTKSGMIVGMGETPDEVRATLVDLAAVGVDIVTIGQYLRPTTHHLPVHRWWTPEEFAELKQFGEDHLGIPHLESSPLTRSSHHAAAASRAVAAPVPAAPVPAAPSLRPPPLRPPPLRPPPLRLPSRRATPARRSVRADEADERLQRHSIRLEAVHHGVRVGVADGDAAEDGLLLGCADELLHRPRPGGPGLLRTGGQPGLGGEQHERLQEHAEVRPLRWPHAGVDETEDGGRGVEEPVVPGEVGEPGRPVVAGDPEGLVHRLAECEPIGAVRLPQIRGVDLVGRRLRLASDEALDQPRGLLTVDDVDPPRLDVAAGGGPRGPGQQVGDELVGDRGREERPDGLAGRHGSGDVHGRSVERPLPSTAHTIGSLSDGWTDPAPFGGR